MRGKSSKRVLRRTLASLVIAALSYTSYQLWSIHNYGRQDSGVKADCAIVLGAAAYHNKPSPVFAERIKHGIQLYEEGRVTKLLFTGGFGQDAEFAEAQVAQRFALQEGVPAADVLVEIKSDKTSENLSEAAEVMKANDLNSALIVSDPWHLKRACLMAEDSGIDATASATPTTLFRSFGAQARFLFSEFYNLHHYYLFHE